MSTSYTVKCIMPITADYQKRLAIYNNCRELKISPPEEIRKYFENECEPCNEGIILRLKDDVISSGGTMDSWHYDIDLSKLPAGVTKVRFEISY